MKNITQSEYERLCDEIWHHNRLYFQEAKPEISDEAFDKLVKKLEEIEEAHPEWVSETSPSRRVGEKPLEGFQDVVHKQPMLSLEKVFSEDEIVDFDKRCQKLLETKTLAYCGELKMDGLAISVTYEKGRIVRAVTRGDGRVGSDVTQNLKTLRNLPLRLVGAHIPETLEVRGEVFLPKSAFEKMNRERQEQELPLWANPRNAAAGSLKLLDPKEVAKRSDLTVVFYGIAGRGQGSQFALQSELSGYGLPTVTSFLKGYGKFVSTTKLESVDEIFAFVKKVQAEREKLPFEIDGVVIKVDDLGLFDSMGNTGKHPRGAVAYKFSAEQAWTTLNEIVVQVGRTGVLTPVAELEPVVLAGSRISRATLHNFDELERKDIRPGDYVCIEKGGDVIPKVVASDHKRRAKESHPFHIPKYCPSCHTQVVKDPQEVALRCPNSTGCPEQILRRLVHFASKAGLEIEHLGDKVMQQLVEKGFVKRFSDIFTLDAEKLAQLDGFKEKSINNLLESIQKAKNGSLSRLIMALGIRHVGSQMADELAARSKSLDNLMKMTKEELLAVSGVGEKVADSLSEYFHNHDNALEIERLVKLGVSVADDQTNFDQSHPFYNKTLCLTGTLETMARHDAMAALRKVGARTADTVSKKVDFLIVGAEAGSKLEKAKKLGITILDEKQFLELL